MSNEIKDSKRNNRRDREFKTARAEDFTLEFAKPMAYAITATVTVTDAQRPEIHPIHRHTVYGIADNTAEAAAMLRSAIGNAGFKTSDFDTRLGRKEMTVLYTKREHIQGLIEEFEWTCQLFEVNKHERD